MSYSMTIGDVAQRAGLQTSAIRYYESVGLLPPPRRVNGRRRYDEDIFHLLGVIRAARQAGFGIAELRALFAPHDKTPISERMRPMAASKIAELDALIARAQARKELLARAQDCRCVNVTDCAEVAFDSGGGVLIASLRCPEPDQS